MDQPALAAASAGERLHAFDALRGFALLSGVVLHAAMSYVPGIDAWRLLDRSTSIPLAITFFVIHMFRMTVFFVMSGFFARLLVERRGARGFVHDRSLRIVVPLVVGWFLIFPLIVAAMQWGMGGQLPRRAAGAMGTHLWFLYVLTLLYAAALSMRGLAGSTLETAQRLRAQIDAGLRAAVRGPWAAFVLSVPLVIAFSCSTWRLWTGIPTPDRSLIPNLPAVVAFSGAFFVGWLLHRQPALLATIERQAAVHLGLAGALTVVSLWMVGVTPSGERAAFDLRSVIYGALYASAGWAWTLALIGIALRFFAAESPVRRYVADASYWIYLAHYPVLMMLQAAMKDLPFHWTVKFPVQLAAALGFLFATYHWLVRRTVIGEVLNGPRHRRAHAGERPPQSAGWPTRTRGLLSRMRL